MNTIELRQKRAGLIAEARSLVDNAQNGMTQESENRFNALMAEADKLQAQAEQVEKLEKLERDLSMPMSAAQRPEVGEQRAWPKFESRGLTGLSAEARNEPTWRKLQAAGSENYRNAFQSFLRSGAVTPELRALQADLDLQGGFLVAPLQLVDRLIKFVDDAVYMRQWATVWSVPNAESLGAPELTADPADADWTTELATGSEDSTMAFGRRDLHPHPLAKRIKISRKLLMKVPSVESLVVQRLGYKFAVSQEKGFLTGSGAGQPLGVFTASAQGISTGRDVSTGNLATSMTVDGLKEAKYYLKPQYWANARWLFHRDGVKQIAKLKDGEGMYLWEPSVRAGEPDRLLNFPVFMSEYAPNTFTTQLYVGILGDFSNYWIADSMAMEMQRLNELYAETNQVGMIGRLETDGMPVLEEAFVRVKLA